MSPDRTPRGRHLVLVGPTTSGKSAVAMALARRRLDAGEAVEIVSVDSMAVYRGMDVGTTTPGAADRAEVRHHLLDLVDPHEEFSLVEFRSAVDDALAGIERRGARALLVGGTGLYVRAVVDRLDPPGRYPEAVAAIEDEPDTAVLHRRLVELDPAAAARIEPTNRRRVVRALEVTVGSGRPFSSSGPGLGAYPDTPFTLVGLRPDRDELRERIEVRLAAQLRDGLLEEVRRLDAAPRPLSPTASQALGYRELLEHLHGGCTLDEALERIAARTRRLAVRQERWFRRDPRIMWFPSPASPAAVAATAESVDAHWLRSEHVGSGGGATSSARSEARTRSGRGDSDH